MIQPATPLTVLTGFLGAGKTTLLNAMLVRPELRRSAVLVNEFGAVGIDHLLVEAVEGDLLLLTGGCICCSARGDLVDALCDLLDRRRAGLIEVDRILIETTGLADPGPVLQAIGSDPVLGRGGRLHAVVTVVDAVAGPATLDAEPEARRQALMADVLVVSKTDLAGQSERDNLEAALSRLNPDALLLSNVDRAAVAAAFVEPVQRAPKLRTGVAVAQTEHHDDVSAVCLTGDRVDLARLEPFLGALVARFGDALLRLKGVVAPTQDPDRPIVLQAVGPVLYPAERLAAWSHGEPETRLVVIVRGVPPQAVHDLWAAYLGPPVIDRPDAAGLAAWRDEAPGLF